MSAITNPRQWVPVDAPLRNGPGERSPHVYRAVLAQFDPVDNPRYRRTPDATYCNIFSWDATRALRCEVPHWGPAPGGGERELTANATLDWLLAEGAAAGWREVLKGDAGIRASQGYPTVAVWKNPSGRSGHIAVVMPSKWDGLRVAQAGASNLYDAPLELGFGGRVYPIRFFTHD